MKKEKKKFRVLKILKLEVKLSPKISKREKGEPLTFLFNEKGKYKGLEKVKL